MLLTTCHLSTNLFTNQSINLHPLLFFIATVFDHNCLKLILEFGDITVLVRINVNTVQWDCQIPFNCNTTCHLLHSSCSPQLIHHWRPIAVDTTDTAICDAFGALLRSILMDGCGRSSCLTIAHNKHKIFRVKRLFSLLYISSND